MTKEIARLSPASCVQLLDALQALGWRFEHPLSAEITGWSNLGEEIGLISPEEAFVFLTAAVGHGVQLWAAPGKDLFQLRQDAADLLRWIFSRGKRIAASRTKSLWIELRCDR
ncbi:hypothetical protein [Variovorax paradoxus]|uniref:hypothetical protein n=1 Tax=Variovorax paradoxus TaxID=34073 RepID=UPI003D65E872